MELKVTPLGGGRFRLTTGPRVRLAHAVVDGPRTHVHLDGRIYVFEASGASRPARLAHEDEALALSAPMPATVVDIAVVPGDRVGRGDLLVMLEAMKMELPIRAPRDATIASVDCRKGDLVAPGRPLLVLAGDGT
jgi:biotin carboxyl carrier protein